MALAAPQAPWRMKPDTCGNIALWPTDRSTSASSQTPYQSAKGKGKGNVGDSARRGIWQKQYQGGDNHGDRGDHQKSKPRAGWYQVEEAEESVGPFYAAYRASEGKGNSNSSKTSKEPNPNPKDKDSQCKPSKPAYTTKGSHRR